MAQCLYCNSQCEYTGLNTSEGCSNPQCQAYEKIFLINSKAPTTTGKQIEEFLLNQRKYYYPPIIDYDGFANYFMGNWAPPPKKDPSLFSVPEINITIDAGGIKTPIKKAATMELQFILEGQYPDFDRLLSLELRSDLWDKINKVIDLDNFHKIQDHAHLYINQKHTKLLRIDFNIYTSGWTIFQYNI